MAIPSDRDGTELHRVVLRAQSCRREEKAQDLRIGLRGPAGQEVEGEEHQQAAKQAVEEVERCGAEAHREEKEFPLGPEDRQWPG